MSIEINANTTQADRQIMETINKFLDADKLLNQKLQSTQQKVIQIVAYGSRALNLILTRVKQTATVQRILIAQQTITTALSIKSTLAQATAMALTNPIGAALLYATAAEMGYIQTQNIIAKETALRNEEYINSINSQMERYS